MVGVKACDGRWLSLVGRIGAVVDVEASARQFGALVRARKLGRGEDLLRLARLHGPGGLSLRATAEAACALGMADRLSDKAVLGRLRRMGDWLEHILRALLDEIGPQLGGSLALVDGTVAYSSGPGGRAFGCMRCTNPPWGASPTSG